MRRAGHRELRRWGWPSLFRTVVHAAAAAAVRKMAYRCCSRRSCFKSPRPSTPETGIPRMVPDETLAPPRRSSSTLCTRQQTTAASHSLPPTHPPPRLDSAVPLYAHPPFPRRPRPNHAPHTTSTAATDICCSGVCVGGGCRWKRYGTMPSSTGCER